MQSGRTVQPCAAGVLAADSTQVLPRKMAINRIRKTLLLLLAIMFSCCLFYLIFVSLPCMKQTDSSFCQNFNHRYEFVWALVSLVYDGLWFSLAYRYSAKGLLLFAWLSTICLCAFGISLIISLLAIFQSMTFLHTIPTQVIVASISSIVLCIVTLILQLVITVYSFQLSKWISECSPPTIV